MVKIAKYVMAAAKRVVAEGLALAKDASWEESTTYRYALNQNRKKLQQMQRELDER